MKVMAMKLVLPTLLGLLLAAGLHAQSNPPASEAAPADKETCSVSGTVLHQDTGEPLSKAKVSLVAREKSEDSVLDLTDSQGHFLLDVVLCGSYTLRASHPGFVEISYGQRKPNDPGAMLTLSPGQKMTGLIFKLQRTAVITGRVFDENGELVQGALVRALRPTGRGKRRYFNEAGRGVTDDLGAYRIFDLKPGRYYVAVNCEPWSFQEGFDPRPKPRLMKKGYPATFYPNTTDPSKAQTLALNPGDELTAIDFRMELVPMNTVSGKILNPPAGNANRGYVDVLLIPRGPGFPGFDPNLPQTFAKNGTFILHRVPPGSYDIQAGYMDRDTMEWVRVVRQLEVTNADVEGVTLAFAPSITVRGRVIWQGSRQGDPFTFTVLLRSADEDSPSPQPQDVKPDGSFLFRAVNEGEYRPLIRDPDAHCYIKSARAGSTPMVDEKLAIHAGDDNSLEFVVSCRASQVEGQVLTSDSLPAAGVFVALVPEARLREDSSEYANARTDQNGHFLLKGIKPGDYKLFSWDAVEEGDWFDADFLKSFEDKGVSVHLEEGDHKRVDLTLIGTSPDSSSKP
jgi:Carboxypeptidase regulatory-like domain